MLYQPVLKEIKQAFSLGSVSGSGTGLLTKKRRKILSCKVHNEVTN